MKQQIIFSETDSDDDSTMVKNVNVVIRIKPKHVNNFLRRSVLAHAHKKHRRADSNVTKTKKRKDQSTAKKPKRSENKTGTDTKWKCAICTHAFGTWDKLNVHVKGAHEDTQTKTKWRCGNCDKSYSTKGNLNRHVKDKHSEPTQKATAVCVEEVPYNISVMVAKQTNVSY